MIGGENKFNAKLDSFFTMNQDIKYGSYGQEIHEMKEMLLAKMGQYAHGKPANANMYLIFIIIVVSLGKLKNRCVWLLRNYITLQKKDIPVMKIKGKCHHGMC